MGRIVDYKVLYEVARAVGSSLEVSEVLQAIVKSVTKAFEVKGCSLMLLSENRDQLVRIADYGLSEEFIKKGPVGTSWLLQEVLEGKNVLITDVTADPRVKYKKEAIKEGVISMLSVPMILDKSPLGVLRIYTSEPRIYSDEETDVLRAIAHLGALALDRARAHESILESCELQIREKVKELGQCEFLVDEKATELGRLEEGRKRLVRLLYVAGHDLKAPLAAVQSYMAVLLEGYAGELPPESRKIVERSSVRALEMIELISDIMDVSRLEAGQLIREMKETPLEPVIKSSLEVVASQAAQKGIDIKQEFTQPLPSVRGDELRLLQMLNNLLVNAVKYTPSGGSVTLRVRGMPQEVLIEVIDTGIGIPPQDLSRLFEEFFRASNAEGPGTGLGLSIVKRIVEAHGGRVWLESPCAETGKGSKFSVILPRMG